MAEPSGGGPGFPTPGAVPGIKQVFCIFCSVPLSQPTAPFCTNCSLPQKKCINSQCQCPIPPTAPLCYYCGTPQQTQQQGSQARKRCINPQCSALLCPVALYCTTCNASQNPAMFQQFLSAPSCVSCSTKLLKTDQKVCHECGAPQPTQTSMIHGQTLPHDSQPSYNFPSSNIPQPSPYVFQTPQPSNASQPPPPNNPQLSSNILQPLHPHGSQSPSNVSSHSHTSHHVLQPTSYPHSTHLSQPSLLLTGSTVQQQV